MIRFVDEYPLAATEAEADRLSIKTIDKDVFAGLKGGDGDLGLGIGVAHTERRSIGGEQRAPVVGMTRHVKLLRHGLRGEQRAPVVGMSGRRKISCARGDMVTISTARAP